MLRQGGMSMQFTTELPIFGRRILFPRRALWGGRDGREELVHLVSPMYYGTPGPDAFSGKYACCLGVLDDGTFQTSFGDPTVTWDQWLLPREAVLTCLECIRMEDLERGRRNAAR